MKKLTLTTAILSTFLLAGCNSDATIASKNIATAADNFELQRRVVFYNGFTGEYMLEIEGRCSIDPTTDKLKVTCKHAENDFRVHTLGLSDNVTYFAEQLKGVDVSVYHTRIVWKPQSIIPNFDVHGSSADFVEHVVEK